MFNPKLDHVMQRPDLIREARSMVVAFERGEPHFEPMRGMALGPQKNGSIA